MLNRAKCRKLLNIYFVNGFKQREKKGFVEKAYNVFKYPENIFSDYLTLKNPLAAATDYDLFVLLYCIDKEKINQFFTDEEIEKYSKQDFKMEMLGDTFSFEALEIVPDQQWISHISTKEIIQLRDNQKIKYNEKTQRTMKHISSGGQDFYQIDLNNKAVESIMKYMQDGIYIPNTLTLNIPDDADFEYSKKAKELRFNNIKEFDILDGYHRYVAISRCYTLDKSFEYPMELRFVKFRESKANQFIFQEDQKTKMKKIDSDSLNQYDYANQVVQKLNEESNLAGLINRNDGIINSAQMSHLIRMLYFSKKLNKAESRASVINTSKELKEKLNGVTEKNTDLLKKPWTDRLLLAFLLAAREYDSIDIIINKMNSTLDSIIVENLEFRKIPKKQIDVFLKEMKGGE